MNALGCKSRLRLRSRVRTFAHVMVDPLQNHADFALSTKAQAPNVKEQLPTSSQSSSENQQASALGPLTKRLLCTAEVWPASP
jgi:hypothetical protein